MGEVMGLEEGGRGWGWRIGVEIGFCRGGWRSCLGTGRVGGTGVGMEGFEEGLVVAVAVGLAEVWVGERRVSAADSDSRCFLVRLTVVAQDQLWRLL